MRHQTDDFYTYQIVSKKKKRKLSKVTKRKTLEHIIKLWLDFVEVLENPSSERVEKIIIQTLGGLPPFSRKYHHEPRSTGPRSLTGRRRSIRFIAPRIGFALYISAIAWRVGVTVMCVCVWRDRGFRNDVEKRKRLVAFLSYAYDA